MSKLFYPGDDVKTNFKRAAKQPTKTKLRSNITPGTVLIVLSGRFRGRRVIFIKQLDSGLLLVTGPYKINGVPLRRINQAYVIPTSTNVSLNGVNADSIDDKFFARIKSKRSSGGDGEFVTDGIEESEEDKANKKRKRDQQVKFDAALIKNIGQVESLKQYLGARFSLRNRQYPHLLKF